MTFVATSPIDLWTFVTASQPKSRQLGALETLKETMARWSGSKYLASNNRNETERRKKRSMTDVWYALILWSAKDSTTSNK